MVQRHTLGDGNTVGYEDFGPPRGFPILVQHGLIASIGNTALFYPLVEAGRRVIAVARPGYGVSSPFFLAEVGAWGAVVESLADALELSRFDVVASSSGAPYAYSIARRMPGRVGAVSVFSGTPALYHPAVRALWPYPLEDLGGIEAWKTLARHLFSPSAGEEPLPDLHDSLAHDGFGIALDLMIRGRPWGFVLDEVPVPVVLEHALDDDQVPFATAQVTAGLLPQALLTTRASGGHFSPELFQAFLKNTVLKVSH